ncbi:hypothetical protein MTR_0099s0130 [Medicago truncatula]|uniref:Uncharacterized protein n=1 Tax=Medicago truncatula TaxID=3880 RepID=A0A072TIL0_MEDTR|nr:hypothetical protein MTR_0099s0130 [Medicago truncatula]
MKPKDEEGDDIPYGDHSAYLKQRKESHSASPGKRLELNQHKVPRTNKRRNQDRCCSRGKGLKRRPTPAPPGNIRIIFAWSYEDIPRCSPSWMVSPVTIKSKMSPRKIEKRHLFITPWGTFCYKVMPFGLINCWSKKGIEVDPDKSPGPIREMPAPQDRESKSEVSSDHQEITCWNHLILVPPVEGRPFDLCIWQYLMNPWDAYLVNKNETGKERTCYLLSKQEVHRL